MAMIRVKLKRTIITDCETEAKCGKNINKKLLNNSNGWRTGNPESSIKRTKNYVQVYYNNSKNSSTISISKDSFQSVGSKIR